MNLPRGPMTNALALTSLAVHVLLLLTGWQQAAFVVGGFIPARFAPDGGIITDVWLVPAILTPLTSAFLHANMLHLAFNLLILLFIGRQLELPLGRWPLLALYVAGAYAGCLLEALLGGDPERITIGASGAISAFMGCYALIFATQRVRPIGPIPAVWVRAAWLAAAWIGIQLLIGFASGAGLADIAIFAHIGGFIAGLILARPLLRWRFRMR